MISGKYLRTSLLIFSGLGLMIGFQNCSKVGVSDSSSSAVALASSSDGGSQQGGPISIIPDGPAPDSETPACDAANAHKQYLLSQLVENGMAEDLSVLKQNLQIQFIHANMAQICEAMGIKVQGEGLCTAFHGVLLEAQDPVSKVIHDIFSVQPASDNSSACKLGTVDQQVYTDVLNALNHADSVDFQASGDLVVKSGKVVVTFIPKH